MKPRLPDATLIHATPAESADRLTRDDPQECRVLVILRNDFGTLHDQSGLLEESQVGRRIVLAEIHLCAKPFARPVRGGFRPEAGEQDSAGLQPICNTQD
jgi:hypothetical protein